jgi:molybdopterin synthase sulfur carrier subunit
MLNIQILFFASLREALGARQVLQLPAGATVGSAREALAARGGIYAELLGPGKAVRCAVNQMLSSEQAALHDGAELAFFPPVTGG